MSENIEQQKVIDSINGIYLVDAGAGTGKTHTITKRYLNILTQKDIEPKDILLVTFTRNASTHMKEKVISKAETSVAKELIDAPIMSFDSFCSKIVKSYGLNAPKIIGIDGQLSNCKLISDLVIQRKIFKNFYNQFLETKEKKYEELLITLPKFDEIQSLIEKLLSRGIYPTKNGWFLDGEEKIKGDENEYVQFAQNFNIASRNDKGKIISSDLLHYFERRVTTKEFVSVPNEIKTDFGELREELIKDAFREDRDELLTFIQEVYFEYISYMVSKNNMTFSLISMFSYLIMYDDDKVRKLNSYKYVMVDEFQDTNEIQFQLMMLMMKENNLCVVGDWKQGIYGFRNAAISNISNFDEKIKEYKEVLNKDRERISFGVEDIEHISFITNYRSSQKILDFSEKSLVAKASKNENLIEEDIKKNIVSLKANFDYDETSDIEFLSASSKEQEIETILNKIQVVKRTKKIKVFNSKTQEYELRDVDYSDIAILSRTRTFGLKLLKRAKELNIPAQYDGGIELFEEEEAILLLAWLKLLLNVNKREAWIPILEKENYTYPQIEHILKQKDYPQDVLDFRDHLLENRKVISYIIDEIFNKYHFNSNIANSILNVLDNLFHSTLLSISDLILFIEENISNKQTYNIELTSTTNSIKIQTIHGSKGLEYPICFIVNMNLKSFPSSTPSYDKLVFNETIGIRNKKIYDSNYKYIFDNWKTDLVSAFQFSDLDEERRLLYVAITRAMSSIYFTSHRPSEFFNYLSNEKYEILDDINLESQKRQNTIKETKINIKSKITERNKVLGVHDLMKFKEGQKGRGMEFGSAIHNLAFRKVEGLPISKIDKEYKKDFENISNFIDNELKGGKFFSEIDCSLPIDGVLIRGIIDLVVEFEERIELIDWKTDLVKDNLSEYRKQLSIYYHVVKEIYPQKEIKCKIFWTYSGECEEVEALELEEIIHSIV